MARTIAIVEDEPAIRDNYADTLRRQGYEVQCYEDRQQATVAFRTRLPDLAVLDMMFTPVEPGGGNSLA